MSTRYAPGGGVAAANHLAAAAGAAALGEGGNAADAALSAAAVMAVTSPHMCGLGGDLFALVAPASGPPTALNASGRAGSGADPAALRAAGHRTMPFRDEIATVTIPGCVDGLTALHERHGSLPLAELLEPARRLAADGFPVSATLATSSHDLAAAHRAAAFGGSDPLHAGARLRLPRLARVLQQVGDHGRAGFYGGPAGEELLAVGAGQFTDADLARSQADWADPVATTAMGRLLWTIPPNSQGYLALSGAWIADAVGVPDDPDDELWAFRLVEAARQAGHDRIAALHEHADAGALLSPQRLRPRAEAIGERVSPALGDVYGEGGTTYVCAVDRERTGVSLLLSNCAGFGSHRLLAEHSIFLHNRGMAFSLREGHPAEYGPGRRPPHTLSPLVVTTLDRTLDAVLGTMGGDAQPQVLLQLLARTLAGGEDVGEAVAAPRWCLTRDPTDGFDTWASADPPIVRLEDGSPPGWAEGLARRGYAVSPAPRGDHGFGHAHMIRIGADDVLRGAADPRAGDGAFVAA